MIFSLFIDEILTMINDMMFSVSLQRLIASKCIRVNEHAVFLSGNGPLVTELRDALV